MERVDRLIGISIGLFALIVYTVALAPDLLYGDSGEFQTLAYTWGMTHPSGYPVYLLLARLVSLLPLSTLAWRVNLVSALGGAVALGMMYFIARRFVRRSAALFACLVLFVSYTFWSQSIIAEVYTPASAVLTIIILLLLFWSDRPVERRWWLFAAACLSSLALGVHLFTIMLVAPAALMFVLWTLWRDVDRDQRRRLIVFAVAGAVVGAAVFLILFIFIDSRPTPTSYYATTLYPSREAYGLDADAFNRPLERFWWSVSGLQWRDRMLPLWVDYGEEVRRFFDTHLTREFGVPALLLAGLGCFVALFRFRKDSTLILIVLLTAFVCGLIYDPGDKYIFYLPAYMMLTLFIAMGLERLLAMVEQVGTSLTINRIMEMVLVLALAVVSIAPFVESRREALLSGNSSFVEERYPYPEDLAAPRHIAECVVAQLEDRTLLVLEWREMWAIYFIAYVEQRQPDLEIFEARPYGANDLTSTMTAAIQEALAEGRPVYTNRSDGYLGRTFTLKPIGSACSGYRLSRIEARS